MFVGPGDRAGRARATPLTFSQGLSTVSPNNIINTAWIKPLPATAGVDIALVPTGTGSFILAIPDGTTTGGNKPGTNSFSGVTKRFAAATGVASGTGAVAIGVDPTASGNYSVCIGGGSGGVGNTAAALNSAIIGGDTCSTTVGASGAAIIGASGCVAGASASLSFMSGSNNTTAQTTAAAFGSSCASDGVGSFVHGQQGKAWATRYSYTHGQAAFSVPGDNQFQRTLVGGITTNATPLQLSTGQAAIDGTSIPFISTGQCHTITGQITGWNSAGNVASGWTFSCVLKNSAGTVTLVAACTPVLVAQDAGAAAWVAAVTADNTNKGLNITVTGAAATTIHWNAAVSAMQAG